MITNTISIIANILILAGITGGLAHYFKEEKIRPFRWAQLCKSILTGVVAAFTVPLFLRMVSSELLAHARNDATEYFVLAGFALIAAYFSQRFLDSMSEYVFRELDTVKREVKDNEDKVDGIIEVQSDPEPPDGARPPAAGTIPLPEGDEDISRIIHAMGPGHQPFRTIAGISGDSGLDPRQIADTLDKMREADLVRSFHINRNNKEVYSLTHRGRQSLDTFRS